MPSLPPNLILPTGSWRTHNPPFAAFFLVEIIADEDRIAMSTRAAEADDEGQRNPCELAVKVLGISRHTRMIFYYICIVTDFVVQSPCG